jgi:hypothetical protein
MAAQTYLAAAALVEGDESIDWRRRAAGQYLITGHINQGLEVLRDVLKAVGLRLPASPAKALVPLLLDRIRLRLRGTVFHKQPASSVSSLVLRRIDVCWSAATGLSTTDFIRGTYFQTRGLLLALRVGEPGRVARALALEAAHAAVESKGDARSLRLIDAADAAAKSVSDVDARGVVMLARGMREHLRGRYKTAVEFCQAAEQQLSDSCTGVTWELDTVRSTLLWALCYLGEFADAAARWPRLMSDARDRGDLYAEANLGTDTSTHILLAKDQPGRALDELKAVMAKWSQHGFHVQHHSEFIATVLIRLYSDEGLLAWKYVQGKERLYRRSMLWRIQHFRIDFMQLRARSALAAAGNDADTGRLLRSAERDAWKLGAESAPWGQALGALMRACVVDAQTPAGPAGFAAAAAQLEAVDLGAFAAAARYRQGERTDGAVGQRLCDQAVAWLAKKGVVNPVRIIESNAPTGRK